jgi:tetratricopeptide (TPR) repeat protein
MGIDIIKIIDQLKDFINNERDTIIGLLFFLAVEILLLNYLFNEVFTQLKQYFVYTVLVVMVITVIIWALNRHLSFPQDKISIAIANFKVISLDIKKGVIGQEKVNLENEIIEYLSDSLHTHKNKLNFDKHITIVNLPQRIRLNEKNVKRYIKKLKANILIWGVVKYSSNNKVFIEPNFEFWLEPKDLFYTRFKERLLTRQSYEVDLTSELTYGKSSYFSHLIHYLIYIALTFDGIRKMNRNNFEEADNIFKMILQNIVRIKNSNRSLFDIYLINKFYEGKSIHLWGKYLLKHKKKEEALMKYDQASKIFFEKVKGDTKPYEKEFLQDFYLYGVHLLIKKGELDKAEKKLKEIKNKFKDNPLLLKEEIELLSKKSSKRTKSFIMSLKSKKGVAVGESVYEQIGDFLYQTKNYGEAEKFYNKKLQISEKQIYDPALLETEDHLRLMKIHVENLKLIKAQKDLLEATINQIKNKFAKTL